MVCELWLQTGSVRSVVTVVMAIQPVEDTLLSH